MTRGFEGWWRDAHLRVGCGEGWRESGAFFLDVLVVAENLREVLAFKAVKEILEEVVDSHDGLVGEFRQVEHEGVVRSHGRILAAASIADVRFRMQTDLSAASWLCFVESSPNSQTKLKLWRQQLSQRYLRQVDCPIHYMPIYCNV